jgi:peptide/nickel transport system substrate-binding protein
VEKSKSLLRQAGVTTPLNIELEVSTGAEQDAILNIAQGNLEDIGMEVEPVRKDAASVDNDIIGLNYTAATTFWGNISANPSVQPLFAIDPNFCCDAYFSGYNDPQLIKLTHKAVTATDEQQAQQLFNQVQIQMAKASYLVPLYYPELTYLASADITGFGADPFGMYDWRTVGLTQ